MYIVAQTDVAHASIHTTANSHKAGRTMIRMSGITEERWQENPHELCLMALFYVAGFVALKYERRFVLDFK